MGFRRMNPVLALPVNYCLWGSTDVTGSTGLSGAFAEELEAANDFPSCFGTRLWGQWAARGVGAGVGALPCCSLCP